MCKQMWTSPNVSSLGALIVETMRQLKEGIPLIHLAPWNNFQLPYALSFFFGATYHDNDGEVEHLHPAQAELYIVLRVRCSHGVHSSEYWFTQETGQLFEPLWRLPRPQKSSLIG